MSDIVWQQSTYGPSAFFKGLRLSRWPNLRCADWLGHAVEDHDALAAAAGRERFARRTDTAVDVLPVVRHPDIACGIDVNDRLCICRPPPT